MNKMNKAFISLDLLSPKHSVNYNSKTSEKSVIGACFTFLCGLLTLTLGIFVGKDIFFKSSPTTRMNLKLATDNKIYLRDFPISVNKMVGMRIDRSKFDEEFNVKTEISFVDITNPTLKTSFFLKLQPCTEEQFDMIPDWRETIGANISEVDCIQNEIYDEHGNVMDQEPFIRGERGQHLSWIVEVKIERKGDPSRPLPHDYYVSLGLPSVCVDNSNYENPGIVQYTGIVTSIEQQTNKTVYVKIAKETVSSDTGLIFSSVSTSTFSTYKSDKIAYNLREEDDNKYLEFKVSGSKIASTHEREYLKLPSVFAEASAMGKLVFLFFKIIMKEVAAFKFYVSYVRRVKNTQKINNTNDSRAQIRKNIAEKAVLPSFLQFVFSSKTSFNCKFVSKDEILRQFDLSDIRNLLQEAMKTAFTEDNKQIPFRKESL